MLPPGTSRSTVISRLADCAAELFYVAISDDRELAVAAHAALIPTAAEDPQRIVRAAAGKVLGEFAERRAKA
jgi:hypothetical protein